MIFVAPARLDQSIESWFLALRDGRLSPGMFQDKVEAFLIEELEGGQDLANVSPRLIEDILDAGKGRHRQ